MNNFGKSQFWRRTVVKAMQLSSLLDIKRSEKHQIVIWVCWKCPRQEPWKTFDEIFELKAVLMQKA